MVILGVTPALVAVVTVIFVSAVKGGCILAIASGATMGMMLSFANIYPIGIIPTLAIGWADISYGRRFRKILCL
mgnify:CR=1 FL=1